MVTQFKTNGFECNAEFYFNESSCVVRFYGPNTNVPCAPLTNLVIVPSCYGFLFLSYVGEVAILSGLLDQKHFSADMEEDILTFIEDNVSRCQNIYLPYHIDFVTMFDYVEYNGEY